MAAATFCRLSAVHSLERAVALALSTVKAVMALAMLPVSAFRTTLPFVETT